MSEADDADDRRHEHLRAPAHRDERDRNACERAQQRGARRDPANEGRDEAAGHQHEALHEHPGQARFPTFHRIARLGGIGSMITNMTMNMCGTLMPEGSAHTSLRPVSLASR